MSQEFEDRLAQLQQYSDRIAKKLDLISFDEQGVPTITLTHPTSKNSITIGFNDKGDPLVVGRNSEGQEIGTTE